MGDRQTSQSEPELSPLAIKVMQATIIGRWLFVGFLWITLGIYGFWSLRNEFPLWQDHLTWAIVRYGLAYHYWSSLGLVICLAYTCAVLVWHSQKLISGWSAREKHLLEKEAEKMTENSRHWLWLIVNRI